jgi:hypothetical protein
MKKTQKYFPFRIKFVAPLNVFGCLTPTRTTDPTNPFWLVPRVFVALIFCRDHVEPHQEDAQEEQLRRLFSALAELGILLG